MPKKTVTKTIRKKGVLNEMPDIDTATQEDDGCIQPK